MSGAPDISSDETRPRGKQPGSGRLRTVIVYGILVALGSTMVLPFLWILGAAFKPVGEFADPWKLFPSHPTLDNFRAAWNMVPFARFFLNSLFIAIFVTAGSVLTSALSGYAFARLRFPGRDRIFIGYLATMMVPWSVVMIPNFILLKAFGWLDSYYALTVPALFSAYGTFMLRQFFLGIPKEYEEAAKIDGCGYLRIFWHVILPLSRPALVTLALFTFLGHWNDLMGPLIFINSEDKMTLPLGLERFKGMYSTDWGPLMASTLLMLIPMLILFGIGQKYFTKGIKLAVDKG
ncbi:MAG: carbohydrate ABC transporter permease [Planctomycetes bacterium]|nr:carbohydrate ABC transporter permease [Planctomycetota bacterium]